MNAPFRRSLLGWYDRNHRDLPWRNTRDPYRIWLSEVMLQQTTVAAVIPHYERFLKRFPELESLANAQTEEVLGAWSGLGYYRRARSLHAAARTILERHDGEIPKTSDALRELPGFGPYTAAAVASIAFGEKIPVVDGNVIRVVSRLAALDGEAREPALVRGVRERVENWISGNRPGDFNQAMMELGATICRPLSPDCPSCPVKGHCLSLDRSETALRPAVPATKKKQAVRLAAVILLNRGDVLLRRRRGTAFLDGLLELPSVELSGADDGQKSIRRELRRIGYPSAVIEPTGIRIRQAITFRDVELTIFKAVPAGGRVAEISPGVEWHSAESGPPLPSLFKKALDAFVGKRPRPKDRE